MAIRRFNKFWRKFCLIVALISGVVGFLIMPQALLAQGIPQRWEARQYKPPAGLGSPTRTTEAGTRGGAISCPVADKPVTALLPSNHFGTTVSAYPTFFVYMPADSTSASLLPVQFLLEDGSGNEVYKANFPTQGKAGIISLYLPNQAGLAPLEVGQDYKWSFSIICQTTERSTETSVEGGVRRVALSSTLNTQLQQASLPKKVELYAEAEIWQDALATLVQLRRDFPDDAAIAQSWSKLLTAAGLDNLVQESLLTGGSMPSLRPQAASGR